MAATGPICQGIGIKIAGAKQPGLVQEHEGQVTLNRSPEYIIGIC